MNDLELSQATLRELELERYHVAGKLAKLSCLIRDRVEQQREIDGLVSTLEYKANGRRMALMQIVDAVKQHHNDPHSDTVAWSVIEQVEAYARRYHALMLDVAQLEQTAGEYIPGMWDSGQAHYRVKCKAVATMIGREDSE